MKHKIFEFIELFDLLYPGHRMLLDFDWSSNHDAMAPDVCTLTNIRVLWGELQKKYGEENVREPMSVFSDYELEDGEFDPGRCNIPCEWRKKFGTGNKIK